MEWCECGRRELEGGKREGWQQHQQCARLRPFKVGGIEIPTRATRALPGCRATSPARARQPLWGQDVLVFTYSRLSISKFRCLQTSAGIRACLARRAAGGMRRIFKNMSVALKKKSPATLVTLGCAGGLGTFEDSGADLRRGPSASLPPASGLPLRSRPLRASRGLGRGRGLQNV